MSAITDSVRENLVRYMYGVRVSPEGMQKLYESGLLHLSGMPSDKGKDELLSIYRDVLHRLGYRGPDPE